MRRATEFAIVCEVEPATRPSLASIREQVDALAPVASSILVPDNHLGKATVSSIVAAREVAALGSHPIACINSRDRNLLGFKRDLLTAAAYGVSDLLLVFGDRAGLGGRESDLDVASMLVETRSATDVYRDEFPGFVVGVTSRLRPLPEWKASADMLFVQAGFDVDALCSWRASVTFDGPIYAGVLVLASAQMAKTVTAATDEISIPDALLERLVEDPMVGVEVAVEQVAAIRASGMFEGVHLIPVGRYRQVAARLGEVAAATGSERPPAPGHHGS